MNRFFIFLCLAVFVSGLMQAQAQNVSLRGKVVDTENKPLAGADVRIVDTRLGVNTNMKGEFVLEKLSQGEVSVAVSMLGYATNVIPVELKEGRNELNFQLEITAIALEPVTVTAQQREQQLLDIPITMSLVSAQTLENIPTRSPEYLAAFVPGLTVHIQTPHRPNLAIRGLTSDETSPTAQPRVSVYYNNVSISRASMAVTELYDMERIEVAKGPQGTLFGRGSQIGAIHFVSKRPESVLGGYLSAGIGNYSMKEVEGAINLPIVKNKLFVRAAGIYSYYDGYVKNTSGGKLNGKNTFGGRFSATWLPVENLSFDLVANYQKDDNPGTAFMSKRYPNINGVNDVFSYEASLDEGKTWFNKRDVLGTALTAKYYLNENNYLSSITSYYTNSVDHRWDGDGSVAPAIDMAEYNDVKQFTQELRYNFSLNSRFNGFLGASYWRENVKQRYWFGPDEQYMAYLIFQSPQYMIGENGALGYPMTAIPDMGNPQLAPLVGAPLPANHEEESIGGATNSAYDIFADATYKVSSKLSLTAGLRATAESFTTSTEARMLGDVPSTLGYLLGTAPNFFFAPTGFKEIRKDFVSLTYRINLKYDLSPSANMYAGYAKGRRPNVLQFNSAGESEVMNDEKVHSFDAGFKWNAQQRYWLDLGVFYQKYNDFQTSKWDNANYLVDDAGRATSYGAEATAKAVLSNAWDMFGNYAYIHARFDNEDSDGNRQEYAGKTFRQTPAHSFLLGLNAKMNLTQGIQAVLTPTYAWKSRLWFEDSNDLQPADPSLARLEQEAYGLLNIHLAFKFNRPNLTLSFFASNVLNQKYLIGAGNTGMMFGVPTYVPGAPRMFGAKLLWRF
ncbi:MAG: TonB-dependent receptor [Tannerellaceae bacterium]|jgi:outer membrane receptor protein involved in Fe transport|nr:TonB-dependent receptor [Tannerellaceae bacterium]